MPGRLDPSRRRGPGVKQLELTLKNGVQLEVDVVDGWTATTRPGSPLAGMVWGHPPGGRRVLHYLKVEEVVAIVELRP